MAVADVDADGRDEVVYQATVVDDDGKGLQADGAGLAETQANAQQHDADALVGHRQYDIIAFHDVFITADYLIHILVFGGYDYMAAIR